MSQIKIKMRIMNYFSNYYNSYEEYIKQAFEKGELEDLYNWMNLKGVYPKKVFIKKTDRDKARYVGFLYRKGGGKWFYFDETCDAPKNNTKIYVTYLLSEFDKNTVNILNIELLDRLYSFGNAIGKEAIIIAYVKDHILGKYDYKRSAEFVQRFKLKPSKAPFVIFSTLPLDEVKNKDQMFVLSFKISNKKIFDYLYNKLADYASLGAYPRKWTKLISWIGRHHEALLTIWNGIKYLKETKKISTK